MSSPDVVPDELPAHIADADTTPPRRRRILRLSTLPTAVTLGNLVCGVLAISYLGDAQAFFAVGSTSEATARIALAGWLILAGMACDGLDGRVARVTRSTSQFGGALDSLADVVTFGVTPAVAAKVIMEGSLGFDHPRITFLTAAFYAVCACLRLARFNVEHEAPESAVTTFSGLPTPGAAGVIAGVALTHGMALEWWQPSLQETLFATYTVAFVVLIGLGLLMVSRVPYMHVMNKLLSGRRPIGRLALILLVVMLLMIWDLAVVVALVFFLYAASGAIGVIPRLLRGKRAEVTELFD